MHHGQLARGQLQNLVVEINGAAFLFIAQCAQGDSFRGRSGCEAILAAAQQGAQACFQFVEVKGLGQIVVGTGVQAHDAVAHGAARGQDQHRRAQAQGPGALQHLQAVEAGQTQVQHHGIGFAGLPVSQGTGAVGRHIHMQPAAHQVRCSVVRMAESSSTSSNCMLPNIALRCECEDKS
jgi:hypothetical protein